MRVPVCLSLCLLLVPVAGHPAQWYPGIIHLHTQFSDGVFAPAQVAEAAKAAGAKFIVVTDHYNEIGKALKTGTPFTLALTGLPLSSVGLWGFDRYGRDVSSLSTSDFVAIPGAEIGAFWEPEAGNQASSHTLAIGAIKRLDSQMMDVYCEKPGRQQDIINKIRQWGLLPVAAHPSFLHNGKAGEMSRIPGVGLLGRIDYRYDKRPATAFRGGRVQYMDLAGVEMWNVDKFDQYETDIDFYLRLIREGGRPFVTAGSDYHGYSPSELLTLDRKTWVYADGLTTEAILKAISAGRTYAAQNGAKLTRMSPLPGEHVTASKVTVKATVEFPIVTTSGKQFTIYRDGRQAKVSEVLPAGRFSYAYEWTDDQADGSEHSYVLRLNEVLLTSLGYARATGGPVLVRRPPVAQGNATNDGHHGVTANFSPHYIPAGGRIAFASRSDGGVVTIWASDGLGRSPKQVYQIPPDEALQVLGSWRGQPVVHTRRGRANLLRLLRGSGAASLLLEQERDFSFSQYVLQPDKEPWLLLYANGGVRQFSPSECRIGTDAAAGAPGLSRQHGAGLFACSFTPTTVYPAFAYVGMLESDLWTTHVEAGRPVILCTSGSRSTRLLVDTGKCPAADWRGWSWSHVGVNLDSGELTVANIGGELWAVNVFGRNSDGANGRVRLGDARRLTRRDRQGEVGGMTIGDNQIVYCDASTGGYHDLFRVDLKTGEWTRITYGADRQKAVRSEVVDQLGKAAVGWLVQRLLKR